MSKEKKYHFFYRDQAPSSEEMARVLLFYDFYGLSFSLFIRRYPSPFHSQPLWLPSTLARAPKGLRPGRAVNYQEGILIKFFIVAVQGYNQQGPDAEPRGDLTLAEHSCPVLLFSIRVPESLIRSNNSTLANAARENEKSILTSIHCRFLCIFMFLWKRKIMELNVPLVSSRNLITNDGYVYW